MLRKQIRTRTFSPITQFISNLIWVLHYVSSLLLHRLLSPCIRPVPLHFTRTARLNEHRMLRPNSALITTQKAHYKTPASSQKAVAERGREGVMESGKESLRKKKKKKKKCKFLQPKLKKRTTARCARERRT